MQAASSIRSRHDCRRRRALCAGGLHSKQQLFRVWYVPTAPTCLGFGKPCKLIWSAGICIGSAGPAAEDGLHLKSFRVQNGLSATVRLDKKYQAFPGIINGGIISALFDCHGNWTAAIALMDRAKLPRPPLTLTAELLVLAVHSIASPHYTPE